MNGTRFRLMAAASLLLSVNGCEDDGLADGLPGEVTCSSCHGGSLNAAPPVSLSETTDPADVAVGAHQSHVTDGEVRSALTCDACHLTPEEVDDEGHVDPLPAEVLFGELAQTDGSTP